MLTATVPLGVDVLPAGETGLVELGDDPEEMAGLVELGDDPDPQAQRKTVSREINGKRYFMLQNEIPKQSEKGLQKCGNRTRVQGKRMANRCRKLRWRHSGQSCSNSYPRKQNEE